MPDERTIRIQKLKAIKKAGINPYPATTERSHTAREALLDFDTLSKKKQSIDLVGRVRAIRGHGGSSFVHIEDATGRIQAYLKRDELGDREFAHFKDFIDVGDFIHVHGALFTTKRGEKTLLVKSFTLLTKSLLPLPEKWHGLSNVEIRYRKRYLDLLSNPEVKAIFETRSRVIQLMRQFFEDKGYLEVETPILQPIYGGGLAKPFTTHLNALDIPLYLRISDELYLKRLIVGGFEKVFEFCRDFRNEGMDTDHNPEFLMFEAMTAYHDYKYSMDLVEETYEYILKHLRKETTIEYQGKKLNFKRPWKRMTMVESIKKAITVDVLKWKSVSEAKKAAAKIGVPKEKYAPLKTIGEIITKVFEEKVEPTLIQPTIIYNYPTETSPLAKKCADDPRFAERFEHFVFGSEHGNHYSELNDPLDLRERFIEEKKKMKAGSEEAHQTDEDFLEAIEHGMPPVTGIGIGVDRLVMVLTNAASIKEVIFFPMMRPEK